MTLLTPLRRLSPAIARRRKRTAIDMNADITNYRPTGDPRLDLARVAPQIVAR